MVRVGNEQINLSLNLKGFIDKTECIRKDLQINIQPVRLAVPKNNVWMNKADKCSKIGSIFMCSSNCGINPLEIIICVIESKLAVIYSILPFSNRKLVSLLTYDSNCLVHIQTFVIFK